MKKIDMYIECHSCVGTGLYSGMAEGKGAAVVCNRCNGTGRFHYEYSYKEFTGRKELPGIDRVYLSGYGYMIGTGKINFSGVGRVDMDKEGVSYGEFLSGKMPEHIKSLACPMLANQSACYDIKGFIDKCNELSGHYFSRITDCTYQRNKSLCWKRFYDEQKKNKIEQLSKDIEDEI
jgi:hypothetical protein